MAQRNIVQQVGGRIVDYSNPDNSFADQVGQNDFHELSDSDYAYFKQNGSLPVASYNDPTNNFKTSQSSGTGLVTPDSMARDVYNANALQTQYKQDAATEELAKRNDPNGPYMPSAQPTNNDPVTLASKNNPYGLGPNTSGPNGVMTDSQGYLVGQNPNTKNTSTSVNLNNSNNNGAIPNTTINQNVAVPPQMPSNPFTQTLNVGSTGSDVANLQKILNAQGANLAVDGQYGPKTQAAVQAYQQANGLTADGIFGPKTSAALTTSINAVGNPQTQPASTIPTPSGVINPNAPVVLPSASSGTFDSSNIGNLSTSDVLNTNQTQTDQINAYLKQQADAYTALETTKAQALQGQADIMYGRNGGGGSDANLQGTEQAMFDRQMAFRTVPAEIAYNSAQMALSLYKQTPAYLTETQARDTAFNMLQTYPDINYAYNPQLSAQDNLQQIKQALPSSAKYQATLVNYKGYVDPNGVFHLYNSKNISGSPATGGAGTGTTPTSVAPGPFTPAPSSENPITPVGTYLGTGTNTVATTAPVLDKGTTRTQVDFLNDWNSGTLGTSRNALGTALGHLFEANAKFSDLNNGNYPLVNKIGNYLSTATGKAAASNYEQAQTLASNELAAAYGGDSQGDREKLAAYGGSAQSPLQHAGYITTATNLLASKLSSMAELYKGAFNHYPPSLDQLMSPINQIKLKALSNTDLNSLVPGVPISPSTQALINSSKINTAGKIAIPSGTNGGYIYLN